eukprot:1145792-Pelagomonas_calceolata.AAC.3
MGTFKTGQRRPCNAMETFNTYSWLCRTSLAEAANWLPMSHRLDCSSCARVYVCFAFVCVYVCACKLHCSSCAPKAVHELNNLTPVQTQPGNSMLERKCA